MKKIDITSQISGIDPKYLDEALTYRAPRVNKIRVLALAACIAVLVTALPLSLIMNREDQAETPETTLTPSKDSTTSGNSDTVIVDPTPLKVVYCGSSTVSPEYLETTVFKDKNIKVEDFESFSFRIRLDDKCEIIDWTPDIPEKLTLSLSNKEYTAIFDVAYRYTNSDNEELNAYAKMARYKVEGTERGYLYYRIETKTIIGVEGLPTANKFDPDNTPIYTRDEIFELACQDVKAIYGEEILDEFSPTWHHSTDDEIIHTIKFVRMIGDYETGSWIEMCYTIEGDLYYCNTDIFGLYDFAEHLLNEERLSEVEKEAQELIGENLVCEKKLMIHKDGYVCVRYILYIGDDERGSPITTEIYFRLE